MSLEEWRKNGWLLKHQPDASEIAELFEVADRDLHDCRTRGLSDDWRFGIAYNAALQISRAALQASGYEAAKGGSQHLRVVQSLEFTVSADQSLVDQFDTFRKKRGAAVYDRAGAISQTDAEEMIKLATGLRKTVEKWMRNNHPNLL
jgi:hypothetical protein